MTFYIQTEGKKHCFDFGALAEMGCRQMKWKYKYFEDVSEIKYDPQNIIVGSVEQTLKYWQGNVQIPPAIDLLDFKEFLGREVRLVKSSEFLDTQTEYPVFVKPYDVVKAFDGTQLTSKFDAHVVLQKLDLVLAVQPVLDILSEYRMYFHNDSILAVKSYGFGDPLMFPDRNFMMKCIDFARDFLPHKSFCLDFGVIRQNGWTKTILIEPNDAWAIGNYGLEPHLYVCFLKDRWLQITNG